jgi:Kef-type K+ transport system membrane component KefB
MSFGILALDVLAGLGGPLLGVLGRSFIPTVVGEILAGILVGPEVLAVVNPANRTIATLGEIGFAMLMFSVGLHLPLRDRRLAASARTGALLAAIVCALAIPAGLLAAIISGSAHAAVFAVVLASGSVAVLLPAIEETGLTGEDVLSVMAQVTIADIITILQLSEGCSSRAPRSCCWSSRVCWSIAGG